jgi:transcription elongation GreA/GreB family factor
MSRAFVKEGEGAAEPLPDRPISPHPNLVTRQGLALIDAALAQLREAHTAAGEDRDKLASIARDMRYWAARRASAQLVPEPEDASEVRFGATVTIDRDGRHQIYRIVGEDEADPAQGTLSYVSPLARALMGKIAGDVVRVGNSDAEIVEIRAHDPEK